MSVQSPTRPDEQTGTVCPTCGASAERGQLICLECGSRITLGYRKPPSPWLPVAVVAAVVLLAGLGTWLALGAVSDDAEDEVASEPARIDQTSRNSGGGSGGSSGDRSEGTSPGSSNDTADKPPAEKKPAKKKAKGAPEETQPAPSSGGIASWPRDREGFTVVVLSAEDRVTARKFAAAANKSGAKLGVIRTDSFSSLPQGFYVVFSGYYKNRARAERAANRLGRRFSGAFPQLVKR